MSSMRSIYDVFAAPTANFGKFDCAIGNMSSDKYVPVERSKMMFISIHIFANQNS